METPVQTPEMISVMESELRESKDDAELMNCRMAKTIRQIRT